MKKVLAFHGKQEIKDEYVGRVQAHRAADELMHGRTGQNGKGFAVWCTFDKYDHSLGPVEIGFPTELMLLNDRIFESLGAPDDMEWPEKFLAAAKPGADLSRVVPKTMLWLLNDKEWGVTKYFEGEDKAALEMLVDVVTRWIETGKIDAKRLSAATAALEERRALDRARALALDLDRARALALDLDLARALARALADRSFNTARSLEVLRLTYSSVNRRQLAKGALWL